MKFAKSLVIALSLGILVNLVSAQEVKINSNLAIEADGTVRMDNTAMVWDDLRVTLDKGSSSAILDWVSGSSGSQIWFFRWNAAEEAMSFTVQLPHNWKEGTTIYPHLHWLPKTTASGNVEWIFEYSWANYNATTPVAFPAATTITVTSTGPFTANTHRIQSLTTGDAGLTGTGQLISSILICRIWRNGTRPNDTYDANAGVLFLDFHYQLDTFGSRDVFTK